MRSWKEFGDNGNFVFNPSWSYNPERRGGSGSPLYVQMPLKETLFDIFAGLAQSVGDGMQSGGASYRLLRLIDFDQGQDPAPDCFALHIPRPFSLPPQGLVFDMPYYLALLAGFPIIDASAISQGFTRQLFDFTGEPPGDN